MLKVLTIEEIIKRGRQAMEAISHLTQEDVREIARKIAYLATSRAEVYSKGLFEENGGSGRLQSKLTRNTDRPLGLAAQLDGVKTVGVIEEDPKGNLVKIAKPIGVLSSLVPMTVPEGLVTAQSIFSIMAKNAIIFSPHPRTKKITNFVVNDFRELLGRLGLPKDLIQCIEKPSKELTEELMAKSDYVIATGGAAMVKAAYSSGTPAFGVGAGNSVSFVDESADLEDAALGIMKAETNDWGAGCSTENSVAIHEKVYEDMINALKAQGGYMCTPEERDLLVAALWKDGHLNVDCIIHSPQDIAKVAGFKVNEDTKFLMAEETDLGANNPMTGEKLAPVIAVWKVNDVDDAIELTNTLHAISGSGHSCAIQSHNEENIKNFAFGTKTARIAVNANTGVNNGGGNNNPMPWTFTLGCGTWGGNAYSENNTFKHYYNTTWVYRTLPDSEVKNPQIDEVFAGLTDIDELFSGYPKKLEL
ncbi:aldehyde dehydrogenase family protein [Peribacillus butanolivorans]|uniref:aldehyde dehydrogenase family protein n=1 Tax=Peribacillus butanolivorans TaxID=421767 RepID=UPI0036559D1B